MNTIEFPFELGTDYEDWEFELEILPDRVVNFDSYLFVGAELNIFLNNPTYKAELIYNFDVLETVVLTFKTSSSSFTEMLNELTVSLLESTIELVGGVEVYHFTTKNLYLSSIYNRGELHLIYSSNYCLHVSVILTLI